MLSTQPFNSATYIRDSDWNGDSKSHLIKSQKKIFKMLDLFEDSANLRPNEGFPLQFEDTVLNASIKLAQDFIDKARDRKKALVARLTATMAVPDMSKRFLMKMQSHAFPEVLMNKVMSYLPTVYHWDNLRLKYTDEFLAEGLNKKSVSRIKLIYQGLYEEVCSHVAFMKQHDSSAVGKFAVHNASRDVLSLFLNEMRIKWVLSTRKPERIEVIISLYNTLEHLHTKWIVKKSVYDVCCSRMMKILHMLVIAVKPAPKKPRMKKVREISA